MSTYQQGKGKLYGDLWVQESPLRRKEGRDLEPMVEFRSRKNSRQEGRTRDLAVGGFMGEAAAHHSSTDVALSVVAGVRAKSYI